LSFGILDRLWTGQQRNCGFIPLMVKGIVFLHSIQTICGAQKWVPGAFSPRVKLPRRESDHSSPSRDEVKNGDVPPLPHIYIYMFLIKHREFS
jgi:hypothetical protein